jgi:pimeloyl-ACP methyl ester carboxylesterase
MEDGQPVTLSRTTGRLYIRASPAKPLPAISLVPGPDSLGQESLAALAGHIVREGMVALLLTPEQQSYSYPEVLAILPEATSWLAKHPEVDTERIGALGYDLGGDLVIRAASTAKELKAVAALAPILGEAPVGLDLMGEMPYPMALRWARNRKRANLQTQLNAAEYADKIAPRPLLLVYGADDRLVVSVSTDSDGGVHPLPAQEAKSRQQSGEAKSRQQSGQPTDSITLRVIPDVGHLNLLDQPETAHAIVQWFREHL